MKHYLPTFLLLVCCALLFAACSSGPPPEPGNPAPFKGVKVGKPYKIKGKWYRPSYDPGYVEQGYASWYGPGFHGKKTANGERFDQYAMTAAHKTLPMPSLVHVKNLENGREIVVRINDRGPFVSGRIIDLSKKAAEVLGMRHKGVAKVQVRYLAEETAHYIARRGGKPLEQKYYTNKLPVANTRPQPMSPPQFVARNNRVQSQSAPVLSVQQRRLTTPSRVAPYPPPQKNINPATIPENLTLAKTGSIIQAASFSSAENAKRLAARLRRLWQTRISPVLVRERTWYRVHVGPLDGSVNAYDVLDKLASFGLPDARIIHH